ncbi:MAG: chitobiase/beta-hexosaminidase C-terminal domain-containing protein [Clostridia bacterium]|nr:chitobiase/beta-hexosaminidase C-terminal domain-containing protein [Clostridia bacterium]
MLRKRLISAFILASMTGGTIPCIEAGAADNKSEPWIMSVQAERDYEDMSIDDVINQDRNYDMTVQPDPLNPKNMTMRERATDHETQGFGPSYQLDTNATKTGALVIEEDVMFTSRSYMEYDLYLRAVDGENGHGYGLPMWDLYSHSLFGMTPELNKWYSVQYVIDIDNARYSIYLKDANGDYLYQKRQIPMMEGLDYSMGFKEVYTRFQGNMNTDATVYTDNFRIYTADTALLDEHIASELAEIEKRTKYYSDSARSKIKNSVVLYIDGPYSYVNNKKKLINPDNPMVCPMIRNDRTLVPVRFVSENFGAKVDWNQSDSAVTVTKGDLKINMTVNSNTMYVNGESVNLDAPPVIEKDRTFIPLRVLAEALGKNVFWDSRGLIVISSDGSVLDSEKDSKIIDELFAAKYGIKKPEIKVDATSLLTQGANERKAKFTSRDSAENVKAMAEELGVMLDLEREELSPYKDFLNAGQYADALVWYEKYFLDGTKKFTESYFDTSFLYKGLKEAAITRVTDVKADNMLFNIIYGDGKFLSVGEPGVVNWEYNKPEKKYDSSYFLMAVPALWTYTTFDPLMYTYMATENPSYFIRWMEYVDDFCINQNLFTDMMPYDSFDSANSTPVTRDYIYRMRTIANFLEDDYSVYSENSFTRLLLKILNDYIVQAAVYTRNNPQNWTNDQYNDLMTTGIMLDDLGLKMGKEVYRIGKRRAESFPTVTFLPDGSDIEQVVAYDIVGLRGIGWIMDTMQDIEPEMLPEEWYQEYKDYAIRRGTFLTHFMTPQGNFPMGFRSDTRLRTGTIPEMENYCPEIYQNDTYQNSTVASTLLEEGGPVPDFTSEAYPYGGYYIFRDGWDKKAQNGMLYGHTKLVISNMGKNVFVLNAFDQDLIAAGEVGMYDYCVTQNFVDGVPQNATAGYPTWGHKGQRTTAWNEPLNNRWGTSEHFDFAETSYEGAYGTGLVPKEEIEKYGGRQTISDLDSQVSAGNNVFYGVKHQRQVNFLRDCGLWVVTDRMTSEDAHKYTTRWTLPIGPVKPGIEWHYKAFNDENIFIDETNHSIATNDNGMPNISIYNFSTSDIKYTSSKHEVPENNGEKTSDFFLADVNFEGKGDSDAMLLSVMYPRETAGDELVDIKSIGSGKKTVGFEAVTGDGTKVNYIAAVNKNETLSAMDVTAVGESLAVVKGTDGVVRGVALGCNRISVGGATQFVQYKDFEFEVKGSSIINVKPITAPIQQVQISPEVDSFADKLEITMSCPTDNTEIHYTTDMSDPTPDSPLYKGPVTITESTVVRARAFRKGTKDKPIVMSCDEASVPVWAQFTKEEMRVPAKTGEVEQGLDYDYYQGNWKKEYIALRDCVPVSSGKVNSLFDISPKQTEKGTFAFKYTGYIDIPEDGLYSFYAPSEYNLSECMTGYELNLYIDGEQWYPATRRFAFGSWTLPLKKGLHTFEVGYSDFRMDALKEYTREGLKKQIIWTGYTPEIKISGPGIELQPIPDSMLFRDK